MKSKFENLFSKCWLPFTEHLKHEMEDDLSISVLNLEFVSANIKIKNKNLT